MDAFDASDPEDSQATQILEDLLHPGTDSSKNFSANRSPAFKTHPSDISSDSPPSSRVSNSIPQYNFHGLASTQTQTQQLQVDEEMNEGSQKENIGSSSLSRDRRSHTSPPSESSSPLASSSKTAQVKIQVEQRTRHIQTNEMVTNKTTSTKDAFQPPRAKAAPCGRPNKHTLQAPTRYKPPSRPVRTDSEDSFAYDPENTEERFLAKSDKFTVPLSELGQGSSPVRDPPNATRGSSTATMFAYTPKRRVASSPPRGKVLVESTPSQSDSSQSQNKPQYDATQLFDETEPENQQGRENQNGNGSDESSEPSLSYHKVLRGDVDPEPTVDFPATQPSTQMEDPNSVEPNSGSTPWTNNPSLPIASSTTSNPRAAPRSLMSMVPPQHRHRYENIVRLPPANPAVLSGQLYSSIPPLPSAIHDTQPSTQPSPIESFVGGTRQSESPRKAPTSRNIFPAQNSSGGNSPLPMDVDVVPDSEPPREPSLRPQKAQLPVPAKHPKDLMQIQPPIREEDVEMTPPGHEADATSDDEDIPLAKISRKPPLKANPGRKPANKGKGKAAEAVAPAKIKVPVIPAPAKGRTPVAGAKRGRKAVAVAGPSKVTGGSWETGVVPSSAPEQDITDGHRNNPARTNIVNDLRNKKIPQTKARDTRSRSTSRAPKTRLRQQANAESEDELHLSGNKDDTATEPIDDEEQEEDEADEAPGPLRKRKRAAAKPVAAGKNIKPLQKRIKREAPAPTPAGTRQGKKLRSAASTASRAMLSPTRVFALWKNDGHFYPGTVHSSDGNSKYTIKFDDGTMGPAALEQLRLCELRAGDEVLWGDKARFGRVVAVVDDDEDSLVKVNVNDGVEEVRFNHLRIASKTITYAWADRVLDANDIVPAVRPVPQKLSPSPSKLSIASLALPVVRGDRKKLFGKTGLIVTLTAANGGWEKGKGEIMAAVRNSGGFVIDDLATIIRMEGKYTASSNRWIITKSDVQWVGDEDIQRLFLLADEPNQKPKFLIALALGIPCLNISWLHNSLEQGQEREWLGYLHPQGFSEALQARTSQQVDVDWGNSIHHLTQIMTNAVPCKLFANKTILCVGPQMVPPPKGKKVNESTGTIPQIILSMGAEVVEAVTEYNYASQALTDYDYVIIREEKQYDSTYSEGVTVHWNWVKECLTASRLLPLPSWAPDVEYSQET